MSVRPIALALGLLLTTPTLAAAQAWPQWRGPGGLGVSAETGIATQWGPDHNIAWRVPLEGLGTSTPVSRGASKAVAPGGVSKSKVQVPWAPDCETQPDNSHSATQANVLVVTGSIAPDGDGSGHAPVGQTDRPRKCVTRAD